MKKHLLIVGIIFLFILSSVSPLVFGSNIDSTEYDIEPLRDYYGCYSLEEIPESIRPVISEEERNDIPEIENAVNLMDSPELLDGPMDSAWPMYCHDTRHTGRSPYSTVDTWSEIWRFEQDAESYVRGSPIIGDDGTVYFGGADFYAMYPDGTLKWKYGPLKGYVWSAPAIDENGTIYFGLANAWPYDFIALNPDGTLKWKYPSASIFSSPVIGDDGTIYYGDSGNHRIKALYPNGTLKWAFKTGLVVYSSPVIGEDGTIYCGSHDTYLYALYPNNGTLKWKYKTGNWIRTSPCIADDGTIYVVSLDNHLHAVNPDGTLKWKTNMGQGGTSPTIGQDGTIYAGYEDLHAINPINGTIKWKLDLGNNRMIRGATPCHSSEDIIFFGTHIGDYGGGEIIAVNPDGTERWRNRIANQYVDSAPAIGEDGTIYFGSSQTTGSTNYGYLHAFGIGELDADAFGPYFGLINQPIQFKGSPGGGISPISYNWSFGDGEYSDEQNPTHTYSNIGNYSVTLTIIDDTGDTSIDTTWTWIQESNDPPSTPTIEGAFFVAPGLPYKYKFKALDPEDYLIWYYIDWRESNSGWIGPYDSNVETTVTHTFTIPGRHSIRAKAKDGYGAVSDWGSISVNIPRDKPMSNSMLFLKLLEQFPILQKVILYLVN